MNSMAYYARLTKEMKFSFFSIGQDSTVNFVDVPSGQVQTIKTRDLPFADTLFISEDSVVCVGHDFTPVLFQKKGDWKMIRKLDQGIVHVLTWKDNDIGQSISRNCLEKTISPFPDISLFS